MKNTRARFGNRSTTVTYLMSGLLSVLLISSSGCGMLGGYLGSQIGSHLATNALAPMVGKAIGQAVGNQIEKELLKPRPQQPPQPTMAPIASQPNTGRGTASQLSFYVIPSSTRPVSQQSPPTTFAPASDGTRTLVVREKQAFDTSVGAFRLIEDDQHDKCVLEFAGAQYEVGASASQSFEGNGKRVTLRVDQTDGPGDSVRLTLFD